MISSEDVKKNARLAHLVLDPADEKRYATELSAILEYVQQCQKIDVTGIEPMSHVHGSTNVFRPDEVEPSLDTEEALKNAPDTSGRFIRVPIILTAE